MAERNHGIYNMRVVCQKLGLSPETLRAWERRYDIVSPMRNEAGHRLYSEQDMQTLAWLVDQTNKGFTIGQAVHLYKQMQEEQLERARDATEAHVFESDERHGYRETLHRFKKAILHWDEAAAEQTVDLVSAMFGIGVFVSEWMIDLQELLWQSVKTGELRIAHERFALHIIRNRMYAFMRVLPLVSVGDKNNGPFRRSVLAFSIEGEPSDIPLLSFVLYLRFFGAAVKFLGYDLPVEEAVFAVEETVPDALVLSLTKQDHAYRRGEWEERIRRTEETVRQVRAVQANVDMILLTDAYVPNPRHMKELGITLIRNNRDEWERLIERWNE
jgi:MerR family transcriptional regulator, light-induced transcriptional regulator